MQVCKILAEHVTFDSPHDPYEEGGVQAEDPSKRDGLALRNRGDPNAPSSRKPAPGQLQHRQPRVSSHHQDPIRPLTFQADL